jgi:hypothetical protein
MKKDETTKSVHFYLVEKHRMWNKRNDQTISSDLKKVSKEIRKCLDNGGGAKPRRDHQLHVRYGGCRHRKPLPYFLLLRAKRWCNDRGVRRLYLKK